MTAEQLAERNRNLAIATNVRSVRAGLKRYIAGLERREAVAQVTSIIADPPRELAGMRARELVLAIRSIGPSSVERLLRVGLVGSRDRLGDLSERQRRVLVERLWREAPEG